MEFEEERRQGGKLPGAVTVDDLDEFLVEKFDASDGKTRALDVYDGVDCSGQRCKARMGGDGVGDGMQPDGNFGNDAERAFRANEEPGQVITGRGLAGERAGPDDLAIGGDDGQSQHILAHDAIADGVGARSTGGGHAADGGIRTGIHRKEQGQYRAARG